MSTFRAALRATLLTVGLGGRVSGPPTGLVAGTGFPPEVCCLPITEPWAGLAGLTISAVVLFLHFARAARARRSA